MNKNQPKYPNRFPADEPIGNRTWPMINGQYQTDSDGCPLPCCPGTPPAPAPYPLVKGYTFNRNDSCQCNIL